MCVFFYTYAVFHSFFSPFISLLPSSASPGLKLPLIFFCFLSNSRISKAKEIEWYRFYAGSVYLSKRSRKQIRGILIDWFPYTTNLNILWRTWVLLIRTSWDFSGRMKYRIYLLLCYYFIEEIWNIEKTSRMSCLKQVMMI